MHSCLQVTRRFKGSEWICFEGFKAISQFLNALKLQTFHLPRSSLELPNLRKQGTEAILDLPVRYIWLGTTRCVAIERGGQGVIRVMHIDLPMPS